MAQTQGPPAQDAPTTKTHLKELVAGAAEGEEEEEQLLATEVVAPVELPGIQFRASRAKGGPEAQGARQT